MDDFSLDHPRMLHLLWALPALWGVYAYGFARRRQATTRFATPNLLPTLIPSATAKRRRARMSYVLAAFAMLVIAMAGPRYGTYYEDVPVRGIDMMFLLDVSSSMLAEDVAPNRLERAKLDIKDMLEVLPGDRVGLAVFAGESALVCPLTTDYGSFRLALDTVGTHSMPRGGTNIGDAVRHAANMFTDETKGHKAIIIASDGGETEETYAVEASRRAFQEKGIRIFAVGIGDTAQGSRIPIVRAGARDYVKYQGEEVWSRLDPLFLQSVAAVAEGGYFSNTDFRAVYDRIRTKVAPREFRSTYRQRRHARFQWFAGIALVLLMIETLTRDQTTVTGRCGYLQ